MAFRCAHHVRAKTPGIDLAYDWIFELYGIGRLERLFGITIPRPAGALVGGASPSAGVFESEQS